MKKLLIIGEKYSSNLGDGIICENVNNFFKQKCITEFCDLSAKSFYNSNIQNKQEVNIIILKFKYYLKKGFGLINFKINRIKNNKKLKETYNFYISKIDDFKPDYILFAGGQMFSSAFCNQINFIVKYADSKKIPVLFNACGIGKFLCKKDEKLISDALNSKNVKYISVRDNYNKVCSLANSKKVFSTNDTAIYTSKFVKKNNKSSIKFGVGIMLCHNYSIKKQINFWKNLLLYLKSINANWQVFCNGNEEDYLFAKYILKICNINDENAITTKPVIPTELIEIITKYDYIITTRLHSTIVSYSYNIPSISIKWDKKVEEFYEKIGSKDKCFNFDELEKIKSEIADFHNYHYDEKIRKQIEKNINCNIENIIKLIDGEKKDA